MSCCPNEWSRNACCVLIFVPQQQNAMGSLHNIDFGVFWASWGCSGKEPGSGNRFREAVPGQVLGFWRWFQVSMGPDRIRGLGFRRWFQVSKVLEFQVLMGFDGFWRFRFRVSMGFRRFRDQELQKTCGTNAAGWGWHNAVGNAVQRVNACVKRLNLLAVGDATYGYCNSIEM